MHSLPRSFATLAAVVAFCTGALAAMLRHSPPLAAARRAGLCALALGLLVWVCTHIALSVLRDGLTEDEPDRTTFPRP